MKRRARIPPPILPIAIAALCALAPPSRAEAGGSLDFKYMYYWDRNGVWNHTPAFAFLKRLSHAWSFKWRQELDYVSGASRRLGLRNIGRQGDNVLLLDGISGASRREARISGQATAGHARDGRAASGSLYASVEDDYTSLSPSFAGSWDLRDRNTTLGAEAALFFDDLHPRRPFAGMGGSRRISALDLSLTRILTPLSLAGISFGAILSGGYLGSPYAPVILDDGALVTENLPDMKSSLAVAGRFIQGYRLGGRLGSARLEARYYRDSWGLSSGTADLQLYQYATETAYAGLRARAYAQGAADFAKAAYDGDEAYRTADIRYYAFTSLTLGFRIGSAFPASWGDAGLLPDRWNLSYDHGFRDTRGDEGAGGPLRHYQLFPEDRYYQQGTFMLGVGFDL